MFGFLKKFKRKPAETLAQNEPTQLNEITEPEFNPEPVFTPVAPPPPAPRQPRNNGGNPPPQSKGVDVPLQAILNILPLELQPRVKRMDIGDATISIPLEKILSQLS